VSELSVLLLARITADEFAIPWGECRCAEGTRRPDCPDRITAEVEAKRHLVRWCGQWGEPAFREPLAFLALPYSDHPDYREEWRA